MHLSGRNHQTKYLNGGFSNKACLITRESPSAKTAPKALHPNQESQLRNVVPKVAPSQEVVWSLIIIYAEQVQSKESLKINIFDVAVPTSPSACTKMIEDVCVCVRVCVCVVCPRYVKM